MKLLFTLAWRNLFRNPKRTVLTLLAIAFSSSVLMFFMGLQMKSYETGINATTSLFHGHGQIELPGFNEKPQMRLVIKNPRTIEAVLSHESSITTFTPRSYAFVLLASQDRSYGAQIVGVDTAREPTVSTLDKSLIAGSYIGPEDSSGAVMGSALAKNLKVSVGDEVSVLGQGFDGTLATTVLTVKGIFESGSSDLDKGMVEIPLQAFDELFVMNGAVHTFAFKVSSLENLENVQLRLMTDLKTQRVSSVQVVRWDELLPGLRQSINLDMSAGWLFFSALICIVFFSVLNTFLMVVLERTKEFGMVLALGMKQHQLGTIILIESAILGALGGGAGILLGSLVVSYFHSFGFTIPGTEEIRKMWHLPATIYPDLTPYVVLTGPLVLFLAAMFAGIYPSLRVRFLTPIKALREG